MCSFLLLLVGTGPVASSEDIADNAVHPDAAWYAQDAGLSLGEASRRLNLQDELNLYLAEIEERSTDTYAGGWIVHEPHYGLAVRFTRSSSESTGAAELARSLPVPVTIDTDAKFSLLELVIAEDELHTALTDESDASSYVDVKDGDLVIAAPSPDVSLATLAEETTSRMNIPIDLAHLEAPVGPGHTYGGMPMSGCTSGFTVRQAGTGLTGVTTAAHCGNSQTYHEFDDSTYSTTFQNEWYDPLRDIQWHTTPHVEYGQFQAVNGTLRDVFRQESRPQTLERPLTRCG